MNNWQGNMTDAEGTRHPVLLCASPEDYHLWSGDPGPVPDKIVNPRIAFCYDSEASWCQRKRAEGRCYLSDSQFACALQRQTRDSDDVDERVALTSVPTHLNWRVWDDRRASGKQLAAGKSTRPLARRPRGQHVSVTITRNGSIGISALAGRLLYQPDYIQIMVEPDLQLLGVQPCGKDDVGAIEIRGWGNVIISARRFLRAHGIAHDHTRTWSARIRRGVLIARLRDTPLREEA